MQSVVVFANTWARVAGFPDSRCIVWVVVVLGVGWVGVCSDAVVVVVESQLLWCGARRLVFVMLVELFDRCVEESS